MKRRILSILLVFILAVGLLPETALAAGETVIKANTVQQLEDALKGRRGQKNIKIMLIKRDYVLNPVALDGLESVTIEGVPGTRIVSNSAYDTVFTITDCKAIVFKNIVLGHDYLPTEEDCIEGVVGIIKSDVTFSNCDIFGCGRDGISSFESTINVSDSYIRDCARSILRVANSTMKFTNCIFSGNGYKESDNAAIYTYGASKSSLAFNKCTFIDNKNHYFLGQKDGTPRLDYVENSCIFYNNAWDASSSIGKDNVTKRPNVNITIYKPTPVVELRICFTSHADTVWEGSTDLSVIKGQEYGDLPVVTRPGYFFKGWYTAPNGGTKITSSTIANLNKSETYYDQFLYAQWSREPTDSKCIVTLNPNGGKVTPTSKTYKANTTLGTLPTPTRTGYKFTGWYTAASGGTKVSSTNKVTKYMPLYAHVTKPAAATKVKITLNANGGKVSPASISVDKNTAYFTQLPTPTRSGYEFDGWFTAKSGGTKITSAAKATANRTIYAHWTEGVEEKDINLQVTFNPNGGTVIQKRKTVLQGTRYRDLPTPTRSGYQFQGWYTAKTGGTKVTEKTKAVKSANHTLYARWSKSALTVRTAESGHWTVYVPPYCRLALFSSQTGLSQSASNAPKASEYAVKCTKTVTLSNGTRRYYGSFNGKNYWFQFSCEMDMD